MRPDIVLEFVFFIISNQKIFHIYFFWICHLFLFIKLRFIYLLNLLNLLNKQTLVLRLVRIVDLQHHTLQITLFFFCFFDVHLKPQREPHVLPLSISLLHCSN